MLDLLYSRYGAGAKDVLALPFEEGIEILVTAQRANNEEKLFMRWVISYQTTMTYEEFKRKLNISHKEQEDYKTEEEILESVKHILGAVNGTEHF